MRRHLKRQGINGRRVLWRAAGAQGGGAPQGGRRGMRRSFRRSKRDKEGRWSRSRCIWRGNCRAHALRRSWCNQWRTWAWDAPATPSPSTPLSRCRNSSSPFFFLHSEPMNWNGSPTLASYRFLLVFFSLSVFSSLFFLLFCLGGDEELES